MKKRILATVLSMVMTAALFGGCSSNSGSDNSGTDSTKANSSAKSGGENVTLTVWSSQEDSSMIKSMCESFAAAHSEDKYTFNYGIVSEADARTRYSEDPAAAADVFAFSNDHLRDFVNSSSLYEVTRNKDDIISRNGEGSVEAATLDGSLYAYPMTADNGYFMYYDKSVFSEDDVKSLDTMLNVASASAKKVFMDVSNGWYIASFFLGNGGTLSIDENGGQKCDFNNANGLAAAEVIKAFTANDAFITGDDSVLQGGMGSTIAAGVSGTWNAEAIQDLLGDNYAAAKLPEMTIGGKQVQMASFGGYKLIGVNSLTAYPVQAMDLADWLTNEENQLIRFETRKLGPTNIKVSENDAVKADIALAALSDQNIYAKPQTDVLGGYWTPAEAFGAALEAKDYSKDLQTMLDEMIAQVEMG